MSDFYTLCSLCGEPLSAHVGPDPKCSSFISNGEPGPRCAICGFVIDNRFEAEKPTIDFSMTGRTRTRISEEAAMLRARKLVEDHIEAYGMVPRPDRLKERIAEAIR